MESENKNWIQNNIGDCTDQYGEHSCFCEALGSDEIIHTKGQLYKDGSCCIDIHVAYRIVNGVCAGAEGKKKTAVSEKQDSSQDQGDDDLHGKTVSKGLFGFFCFIFSHKDAGSGSAAISNKGGKRGYYHNKWHTDAYTGKSKSTISGNVANVDTVYNVVEHVNELCGYCGKCETQKQLSHRFCT